MAVQIASPCGDGADVAAVRCAIVRVCGRVSADIAGCSSVLVWADVCAAGRRSSPAGTVAEDAATISTTATAWPLVGRRFRAFVRVGVGRSRVTVQHGFASASVEVERERPPSADDGIAGACFVRPVYIICRGGDDGDTGSGRFQGPPDEDCSAASARRRLALAAELLQCFTAENLHLHGLGRRTFHLVLEPSERAAEERKKQAAAKSIASSAAGAVATLCSLFESRLSVDEAHAMSDEELWRHFARELTAASAASPSGFRHDRRCKYLAFMSFTRYRLAAGERTPERHADVLAHTRGHATLGGGGLALCGTGNLHTWPESLEDLVRRFTDNRKIDMRQLMDDSCYRRTHWANFSTGLGAAMHELGHALGLSHTEDGIMGRGFNDMHRFFVLEGAMPVPQPPSDYLSRRRQRALKVEAALSGKCATPVDSGDRLCLTEPAFSRPLLPACVFSRPPSSTDLGSPSDRQDVASVAAVRVCELSLEPPLTTDDAEQPPVCGECLSPAVAAASSTLLSPPLPPGGLPIGGESNSSSCSCVGRVTAIDSRPKCSWTEDGGAHWSRSSAIALRYCRWLTHPLHGTLPESVALPSLTEGGRVLHSPAGLRLVELLCKDASRQAVSRWEYVQEHSVPPVDFNLAAHLSSLAGARHQCDTASCNSNCSLVVVDGTGRSSTFEVPASWLR